MKQLVLLAILIQSMSAYAVQKSKEGHDSKEEQTPIELMTPKGIHVETAEEVLEKNFGPFPHEREDTPRKANANIGRYLYVGTVPKFLGEELELTVSKMSLSLRATGWITQEKIDNYGTELFKRWKKIDDALHDSKFILYPLVKIEDLPTKDTSIAWAKIAGQYSKHILEVVEPQLYSKERGEQKDPKQDDEYKSRISQAILRLYFNNPMLSAEAFKNDNQLRERYLTKEMSRSLFRFHHGDKFTQTQERSGFVGFLTLVYPIAATTAGPFSQPAEGHKTLMNYGTINARWWSDKWDDEFGGLPFILIEKSGVAFHGPITNFAPLDVWFLRRGYVSHGCHRMDTSDVIELRSIMPNAIKDLGKVKITIFNHFDVTDWNRDGALEVVDVKYYSIPTSISIAKGKTIEDVIAPYKVENQMTSYFATHTYAKSFYDKASDRIKKAPRYKIEKGQLLKDGVHEDLPIHRFEYPKNRILQYQELGNQYRPYDDNFGMFPPSYFF